MAYYINDPVLRLISRNSFLNEPREGLDVSGYGGLLRGMSPATNWVRTGFGGSLRSRQEFRLMTGYWGITRRINAGTWGSGNGRNVDAFIYQAADVQIQDFTEDWPSVANLLREFYVTPVWGGPHSVIIGYDFSVGYRLWLHHEINWDGTWVDDEQRPDEYLGEVYFSQSFDTSAIILDDYPPFSAQQSSVAADVSTLTPEDNNRVIHFTVNLNVSNPSVATPSHSGALILKGPTGNIVTGESFFIPAGSGGMSKVLAATPNALVGRALNPSESFQATTTLYADAAATIPMDTKAYSFFVSGSPLPNPAINSISMRKIDGTPVQPGVQVLDDEDITFTISLTETSSNPAVPSAPAYLQFTCDNGVTTYLDNAIVFAANQPTRIYEITRKSRELYGGPVGAPGNIVTLGGYFYVGNSPYTNPYSSSYPRSWSVSIPIGAQSGTIVITANVPGAFFYLTTDAAGGSHSDFAPQTYKCPPGSYSIQWVEVDGYTDTPSTQTGSLAIGETLPFQGIYGGESGIHPPTMDTGTLPLLGLLVGGASMIGWAFTRKGGKSK